MTHRIYALSYKICFGILTVTLISAIMAPFLSSYTPYEMQALKTLEPPSFDHWLGTDRFGRDVLTRLIYGARISFLVAASSVSLAFLTGSSLGMLSAYHGGFIDKLASRLIDTLMVIPELILALIVISLLGTGLIKLSLTIAIIYTPLFYKIARAELLKIRNAEYIEASRLLELGVFIYLKRTSYRISCQH